MSISNLASVILILLELLVIIGIVLIIAAIILLVVAVIIEAIYSATGKCKNLYKFFKYFV